MTQKQKQRLHTIFHHLIVAGIGIIMMYPLIWMVSGGFKSPAMALDPTIIPDQLTLQNFYEGWQGFAGVTFGVFFRNSFFISTTATIGQIIFSAISAYAFARLKFPGRKIFFGIMILTLLLPMTILRIPQYILFHEIGWTDTWLPVILPQMFPLPFFTFMMTQFLKGISKELDYAAMVDGCSRYGVFFRVLLPILKPALITAAIFSFYWTWNDFMSPLLYLQSTNLFPVSLGLHLFADPDGITNWGALFAMSTLSILPIFLIFVFFQKYIVEGIQTSGLKQ